ncbi:MAG TPA: aminotransferase class IV [Gemmatimonadaceae bacterium]|nr:aminotransferase class IV [Gemmatimonadaceae bacterium]
MTTTPLADAPIPQTAEGPGGRDIVYFDGRYLQKTDVKVSPDDRGFLLGDGVYEVAAAYNGNFVALDRHLDRLRRSLTEARIDSSVADPLESVFQELLERNGFSDEGKAMVYLQVTRGAAPRTHAFPKKPVRPTVYAYATPFPDMGDLTKGVGAITRPDLRWSRCDVKAISLMANCLANQEAKESGAFEAILIRDGIALEGTHTSFFGVVDGVVRTAPLSNLILPGVTREIVIDACNRAGIVLREEAMDVDTVERAEELFITGTTTEVVPLIAVDGKPVGSGNPGPLTTKIAALYRSAIAARP